jgi:ubiquinone/menaquinone biosynthesis C-methylase UbiE
MDARVKPGHDSEGVVRPIPYLEAHSFHLRHPITMKYQRQMSEPKIAFDDGAAYDRFMGRWSRAVGTLFLEWLAPAKGARWLDVGCGTGAFTQLVLDHCAPGAITGVDPAAAQIDYARKQPLAKQAEFRVADATALPFDDGVFDVVASALVINFIPDHAKGLAEMRRVSRPGGIVAGYMWDRSPHTEFSPTAPMQRGFAQIGAEAPRIPGAELGSLPSLFAAAGFEAIETRPIDVTQTYRDFEDYWSAQTLPFTPAGKLVAKMSEADRARLRDSLQAILPPGPDGSITYSSRAAAIKARVAS